MFRDMNAVIGISEVRPAVYEIHEFDDVRSAYHALGSDAQPGNIPIRNG